MLKSCDECGSTDYLRDFGNLVLCEKCLFWYDIEDPPGDDEDEYEEVDDEGSRYGY